MRMKKKNREEACVKTLRVSVIASLARAATLSAGALGAALVAASTAATAAAAGAATPLAVAASASSSTAAASVDAAIAWRHAASDADIDAAFRQARADVKPLFLYWGAAWCPPCNQVKATLFNRQEFIERTRAFVAVYVDGDSPGAQKLGARFHVGGYPTMVLFSPEGAELTRLPGEVEPQRYMEVVTLAINARRPVKAVLASALAGQELHPGDWRLLAFYAWDADEQQLVPKAGRPALLKRLAAACPVAEAEAGMRLWLQALGAGAVPDLGSRARLLALLADPARARRHFDGLVAAPAELTRVLSTRDTPERAGLRGAFEGALRRFEQDPGLSRADRLSALGARVELARIDIPTTLPKAGSQAAPGRLAFRADPGLVAEVREQAARADRDITDGYERQAVIPSAASLLADVGLDREADALLEANLAKSHSPYYLMSGLAGNAEKRGDRAAALRWYRLAYERSEGPATRLQWGARYIRALVELAPADEKRIEAALFQVLDESALQSDAFYERSAASLRRMSTSLRSWNQNAAHAAVMGRFDDRLGAVCKRIDAADPQRATCHGLLDAAPKKAT